jgi:prepilin-type N-terminal cleavage/methylation domain-containing protein
MRRRGFTLIELLLATALSAIIAVAVGNVVSIMHKTQQRIRDRGDRRSLLAALERRIAADIAAVVPPAGIYAAGLIGENEVGTTGGEALLDPQLASSIEVRPGEDPPPLDERDQLTLAVLPGTAPFGDELPPGEGALWQVVYRIDDDPSTDERGLVREVQRIRDQPTGVDPPPATELCRDVVAMDLAFFDGEVWAEVWDSGASDTLPTAVQVKLVVALQDELVVYTILVAPPAGRPSALLEAEE